MWLFHGMRVVPSPPPAFVISKLRKIIHICAAGRCNPWGMISIRCSSAPVNWNAIVQIVERKHWLIARTFSTLVEHTSSHSCFSHNRRWVSSNPRTTCPFGVFCCWRVSLLVVVTMRTMIEPERVEFKLGEREWETQWLAWRWRMKVVDDRGYTYGCSHTCCVCFHACGCVIWASLDFILGCIVFGC